jgi:hypothetical protein
MNKQDQHTTEQNRQHVFKVDTTHHVYQERGKEREKTLYYFTYMTTLK